MKILKNEDGTLVYELGVIYFEPCMRDTSKYKKMMTWWLVDVDDVLSKLQNPKVEKISGRGLYTLSTSSKKAKNISSAKYVGIL